MEKFGRFQNMAGIGVLWDSNDLVITGGYDHSDYIATKAISSSGANLNTSSLNYSTDEVTTSAFFHFMSNLGGGLEATSSYVTYKANARMTPPGRALAPSRNSNSAATQGLPLPAATRALFPALAAPLPLEARGVLTTRIFQSQIA